MVEEHQALPGGVAQVVRTVLVIDVVESVRLIQQDEEGTVRRWRAFVDHVVRNILPEHAGRLVKSLGDGMMVEFAQVLSAVRAAFAVQQAAADANRDITPARQIWLRIGAHMAPLVVDERDVYGHGVNLAARLASLAGPGEIVVSADVHDRLTPTLDADVEDLGECFLKHVEGTVRAYRLGLPGPQPIVEAGLGALPQLSPAIAVIPFRCHSGEPQHDVLGQVLADDIIAAFSRSPDLMVVSRLSTTAFRERDASLEEIAARLQANYVLSGSYRIFGQTLLLSAELDDARTGHVVWAKGIRSNVDGIVSGKDPLVEEVVGAASAAIIERELQRAQSQAWPTLECCTLLLAAIALMHRLSPQGFERAGKMLETLIDRAPRLAPPYAWLAKWHVLRVQQGWSPDPMVDARRALDCTKRAVDHDSTCSLALAVDGFVHTNLLKQLDVAMGRYELALSVNPSDSLAWLLMGTLNAFQGEGKLAVKQTRHALKLSPLDPMHYFYQSLAATAALSARDYKAALDLARRSLRLNRTHTSTLRAMAIAQWELGDAEAARATVRELLRLDPSFTITRFLARSPSSTFETGKTWANALAQAGVPQ
ncbi:MAG TPA: adenylate/guanylate cyclase domain-containing protein [Burkholderiaceae bacterium]|nr:adenylate/guanylate cyclase domain-containing protein [Burkholderiaceae bacterium]